MKQMLKGGGRGGYGDAGARIAGAAAGGAAAVTGEARARAAQQHSPGGERDQTKSVLPSSIRWVLAFAVSFEAPSKPPPEWAGQRLLRKEAHQVLPGGWCRTPRPCRREGCAPPSRPSSRYVWSPTWRPEPPPPLATWSCQRYAARLKQACSLVQLCAHMVPPPMPVKTAGSVLDPKAPSVSPTPGLVFVLTSLHLPSSELNCFRRPALTVSPYDARALSHPPTHRCFRSRAPRWPSRIPPSGRCAMAFRRGAAVADRAQSTATS